MRLDSYRDADDGRERSGRRRRYRAGALDWKTAPQPAPDSPPHPREDQAYSHGRRTRPHSRSSSQRTLDATDPTMPPPLHLARSSTDVYRRPRHWMAYDDRRDPVGGRRRSRRDVSPVYARRVPGRHHSGYSSASGHAYGGGGGDDDDDDDDDEGEGEGDDGDLIEVVEEADHDDDSSRHRAGWQSSRDDYVTSSAGGRRHHGRRWRRRHGDDGAPEVRRCRSFSSPARESSSRAADRSGSSRLGPRPQQVVDVIEDSRPPVSSKRSTVRRRHRSAEATQQHEDRPRASSATRPSRSRAGSLSGGPSGILSSIFGAPSSRRASPEEQQAKGQARGQDKEPRAAKRLECVICMGDVSRSKAARLRCGHAMCRPCLERIFKLSLTDPQHMPPRCCTQEHIPLRHVDGVFDDGFKRAWDRKFAEFSTRDRVYCPSRRCGEWIRPAGARREHGRKMARCGRCRTKVCCACNGKWHGVDECPRDEETARLLAQAQEEGWKRCYRCKAVVELREGCNHMTCRCGAEFCMICGAKWKRCDCPWFNDDGFSADVLDHANVPVPQIRGDLADIFDGEGPPALGLSQRAATLTLPTRPRPPSYHEDMLRRRLQGQRDAELARHLQYADEPYSAHDVIGGRVGDIHGVGNAAGHLMNEGYRGAGRFRAARATTDGGGADYVADADGRKKRAGSMERRLADRLSETRPRTGGMRARVGGMAAPMRAVPETVPGAVPGMAAAAGGPRLRQHSLEEELYSGGRRRAARSERVAGGRLSRSYEDEAEAEAEAHAARGQWLGHGEPPRSSDMAGLNGFGQGVNRVPQWRSFVEPGVPDGESTVGHA